jgi:hypothetical protein
MSSVEPSGHQSGCLSRQPWLLAKLQDVTAFQLGKAARHIREFLSSLHFDEVILSPFDTHAINYLGNTIDVQGIGQLRFNTEPEIWESSHFSDRYYSISTLFRRETIVNALRRSAFFIVDVYQPGSPETMLPVFQGILSKLAEKGFAERLSNLPFGEADYDPSIDGPRGQFGQTQWVITNGYDARHSFFEIDDRGHSTRREIFLVTPFGFLEVGVLGITGWNRNPEYFVRNETAREIKPDVRRSGLCVGLERLILAEQILPIVGVSP